VLLRRSGSSRHRATTLLIPSHLHDRLIIFIIEIMIIFSTASPGFSMD
jgi:hypothetical protein